VRARGSAGFVTAALLGLGACGDSGELGAYPLYRNLLGARRVEVVVPPELDLRRLAALARELERRGRWEVELERGTDLDPRAARIWIADGRTQALGELLQRLQVRFEPDTGAFWFEGRRYAGPREAVQLTVADPRRDGWPVTAVLASDAATAASFVATLEPGWKPSFRCFRDGRIEREGVWTEHGGVEPSSASSRAEALGELAVATVVAARAEVVVHGAIDARALEGYLARLAAVEQRTAELFEGPELAAAPPARVHVWPDLESVALATGRWEQGALGPPDGEAHVALAPGLPDDGGFAYARLRALALAGPPADDWLADGAVAACVATWHGRPIAAWTEHVLRGGFVRDAFELEHPPVRASPHAFVPLRGLAVRELRQRRGAGGFLRLWREGGAAGSLPADWLALQARSLPPAQAAPGRELASAFVRGIHLVPPRSDDGRSIRGLASRDADAVVRNLAAAGFDALALSPAAAVHEQPATWPAPRSEPFEAAASDAQLLATAARAKERGLALLLAPQLLDSRGAGLTGWTSVRSRADWEEAFRELEACLVHYGLVAELAGAQLLVLASGIEPSARSVYDAGDWWIPDYQRENDRRWEELIPRVRAAFGGALTYGAGGFLEAQQIEFWDALDLLGVSLYRSPPSGDDAQLVQTYHGALRQMAELADAVGKPLLVTEAGFPPTSEGWREPEIAEGTYDVDEQARMLSCFAKAVNAVRREGGPLRGVFLWCWGTDLEHGNGVDRSFAISNRPAGERAGELFP
jgi:hypothetical protein